MSKKVTFESNALSTQDGQVKRELLKSAVRLLGEFGAKGATARAICAEVGVGAPALYHHYGDLAALHTAAIDEIFRQVASTYRRSTKIEGPLQGIRDSWALFIHIAREEPLICRMVIQQILAGNPPRAVLSNIRNIVKDLASFKAEGLLRYPPEFAAELIWIGAIGTVCYTATERNTESTDPVFPALQESMIEAILSFLFNQAALSEHSAKSAPKKSKLRRLNKVGP